MEDTKEVEKVFDVKEVADYLRCSQSTVRKLLRKREIPCFRIACRIYFKKSLIDLWIQNQCLRSCEVIQNEQ